MNFKQSFRMAVKSIKTSKMRAFLTMLGIIIGVASVIVLVSLMNGLTSDITSQFESMGTNTLTVMVMGRGGNRSFDVDQMEQLVEDNPQYLASFSPVVSASVTAKSGTESVSTSVTGVNEQYEDIQSINVESGRFLKYIDVERRQRVCVIGTYLVQELFGGLDPVGQTLKLSGVNYTVIGVLEETGDSEESSSDDIIYMPYTSAMALSGTGAVSSYTLAASDRNLAEQAKALVENALYKTFSDDSAYRVSSMSEMIDTINDMTGSMTMVLVGIAGISLLVGGIGIMNIMLVSVTERTREIGIRKSLGAKRRDIMRQFVIEAATTSSIGGVVGILFGIAVAYGAGAVMDMTVVPSAGAVLLAFSVSVGIGMIFGYFPANKAAKLNPIDALHYD